jgi:hypothetical protein
VITAPERPEEGLHLLERAVKNGFRDRKRLADNPAFSKLEGNAAYQNLLQVFGHGKATRRA